MIYWPLQYWPKGYWPIWYRSQLQVRDLKGLTSLAWIQRHQVIVSGSDKCNIEMSSHHYTVVMADARHDVNTLVHRHMVEVEI